jgi:hypothetical protein
MLLHPRPARVLVIGWGAGATAAAAAAHPLERLECVEIEPATWEAAPYFPDFYGPLQRDPRFEIVFRDGRNHLLRSGETFDLIVSEPSNPWITGVSNLFTREFLEAALARLAPGGLFAQWFHYYNLDPSDLKVEIKTFLAVFPHASLWLVPPVGPEGGIKNLGADVLLVGGREPQRLDWPRGRGARPRAALHARARGRAGPRGHLDHGPPGDGAFRGGPTGVPWRDAAQHGRPAVPRVRRPAAHRGAALRGRAPGHRAVRGDGRSRRRPGRGALRRAGPRRFRAARG